MINFVYLAGGFSILLVAIVLVVVLLRLNRTLAALEELVQMTTDEMRETLPEVRQTLGTVNDIAAGVNIGIQSAGSGLDRAGGRLRRVWWRARLEGSVVALGVKVGGRSLLGSYDHPVRTPAGVELEASAPEPDTPADADLRQVRDPDPRGAVASSVSKQPEPGTRRREIDGS